MKNLIQQLKDNEKPFGLMGEEMQVKAAAMGLLDNFQLFVGPGWGGVFKATGCRFFTEKVYRLRPDYEDEPPAEVTISRVTLEAIIEIAQKALDK